MYFLVDEFKLVSTYSIALLVIVCIAIAAALVYKFYLKPTMQLKSTEIIAIEPINQRKAWMGIGLYFICFYLIAIVIQFIILFAYSIATGNQELTPDNPHYATILNICNFSVYLVTIAVLVPIFLKEIKKDLNLVKVNPKFYFGWWGKGVLIMIGLVYLSNIIQSIFTNGFTDAGVSENQKTIDSIMNSGFGNLFLMGLVTVFFAPIVEEIVFRKCLFGIFKKNSLAIVFVSALLFASIHVVPECISIITNIVQHNATVVDLYLEFICIISYLGQAFAISFVYYKSRQNIIPCILIHFTNNFIALTATFLLQFMQ